MVPALPLIAVGVVAAAAGWAGAGLWQRLHARRREDRSAAEAADRPFRPTGARPSRTEARPLIWCPACRTYFVAAEAHGCEGPDCPLAGARTSARTSARASGSRTSG